MEKKNGKRIYWHTHHPDIGLSNRAVIFFWPKPDVTPALNTAPIQHQLQVESTDELGEKALEASEANEASGEEVAEPQAY